MSDKMLGGRYRILQPLGYGGFGETFLAEDTQFPGQPHCVVKKLRPQLENPSVWPDACRLFQQEAETLSRLGDHEQIPRLLAHFEEEEHFFLVQELISGADLSQELVTGKKFSEYYTVTLLDGIFEVLEFVHQQGVIHRDIKPSNLIRRQPDSKIVLIDFGAVKAVGLQTTVTRGHTAQTVSICTPGYTPAEQYSGQPKLSSDIYAAGMVGIQALTGQLPDQLEKDPQTGEVIWQDQATVSPHLATILNKMVLYNFQHRYHNATEARTALQHLLNTQSMSQPVSQLIPQPISSSTTRIMDATVESASSMPKPVPVQQSPSLKPKLPIRTFFVALFLGLCGGAAGAVYMVSRFFPTAFAPEVAQAPTGERATPDSTRVEGGPGEVFPPTSELPRKGAADPADTEAAPTELPKATSAPVEVDYTPLRDALTAGQWKNADQITRDLLLSVTGRAGSTLRVEDVEQIPCQDLRTVNQYWEQASQGQFGFKTQTKVWQSLVGKFTDDPNVQQNQSDSALYAFGQRTKWSKDNKYYDIPYQYGDLVFALNASPGHLPAKVFIPEKSPTDRTNLRGAARLIPTLAQRTTFCERQTTSTNSPDSGQDL